MIWAIARNTILMIMRRRIAVALIIFAVGIGPLMSFLVEGDNTLAGLLRLILTYNFTIMSGIMMLLMLFLSSTVLNAEIEGKQIYMVTSKPIHRWKILLGKWLGVVMLTAWLLLIMGCLTYIVIIMICSAGPPGMLAWAKLAVIHLVVMLIAGWLLLRLKRRLPSWFFALIVVCFLAGGTISLLWFIKNTPRRFRASPEHLSEVYSQVLVSRRSFRLERPDIDAEIESRLKSLERSGEVDRRTWDPAELRSELEADVRKNFWRINFGVGFPFLFKDLPVADATNRQITIRYTFHARRGDSSGGWIYHQWIVRDPVDNTAYVVEESSKSGKPREIHLPASAISKDGRLEVIIVNLSAAEKDTPPATLIVPLDDGLEILVPTGTFEGNLSRALALLWIRLAMIAAVGIAANTFLGGPVTAFLVLGLLTTGTLNSVVYGDVSPESDPMIAKLKKVAPMQQMVKLVLRRGLDILPDFSETDPIDDLTVGRQITLTRLLLQVLFDIFCRAGPVVIVGLVAFNRCEVGIPRGDP